MELLENRKIDSKEHQIILKRLINEKIQELEVNKFNINIDKKEINKLYNSQISLIKNNIKNKEIERNLKKKIEKSMKWKNIIFNKYKNKLNININEINEIVKNKNLSEDESENIILLEKNKKFNVFSNIYFNEIKKKYYIKVY